MNNFELNLTQTNESLKQERAVILARSAERGLRTALDKRKTEVDKKEDELLKLRDLAPKNAQDLTYRDDFKGESWGEELAVCVSSLAAGRLKLKAIQQEYDRWFLELPNEHAKGTTVK